jgi:hypothetical protein
METAHTKNIENQYSNLDELIPFLESDRSLYSSELPLFDSISMPQEKISDKQIVSFKTL